MEELLKKIQEIHFRWNIGKYKSAERNKLTAELIDNYTDEKFKNLDMHFVMRSYLKEMAKKHNLPESECLISIVDCNIQVKKYVTNDDKWIVVENIEI